MKRGSIWNWLQFRPVKGVTVLALVLSGCASTAEKSNQEMMTDAGFKKLVAQTPAQQFNLKYLTQQQITIHEKNGEKRFVYADAEGCNCVYVGTPEAYKKLNAMVDQKLAEQQGMAGAQNMDEAMYWEDWPPGNW